MSARIRLTEKVLLQAARSQRGNLSGMARVLDCSRRAVYDAIARSEKVQMELHHERERIVDICEAHLYKQAYEGKEWAVKYVLSSQGGRRRGWGSGDTESDVAALEQKLAALIASVQQFIDDVTP